MSKQEDPEPQDAICLANINAKLDRLSIRSTKDLLDHYLFDTADRGIDYFSREMRTAFCRAERLAILPPRLIPIIKAKSAIMYIEQSKQVNNRIFKLYCTPDLSGGQV